VRARADAGVRARTHGGDADGGDDAAGMLTAEPFSTPGVYDFGAANLTERMSPYLAVMLAGRSVPCRYSDGVTRTRMALQGLGWRYTGSDGVTRARMALHGLGCRCTDSDAITRAQTRSYLAPRRADAFYMSVLFLGV
jgi:hypothetical protein